MSDEFKKTWEAYTSSWKAESSESKRAIFQGCLDDKVTYSDPLVKAEGWDELAAYMLDFHRQVPGGHFTTNYFLAHNNQSIARWEMRDGKGAVLSEGISYGKYTQDGKLTDMTGFFELP